MQMILIIFLPYFLLLQQLVYITCIMKTVWDSESSSITSEGDSSSHDSGSAASYFLIWDLHLSATFCMLRPPMDAPALEARCHMFLCPVGQKEFLGSSLGYGNVAARPQHVSFLFLFLPTSIFTAKKSPLGLFIHQSFDWFPQLISTGRVGCCLPILWNCIFCNFPKSLRLLTSVYLGLQSSQDFPCANLIKKVGEIFSWSSLLLCKNKRCLVYNNIIYLFLFFSYCIWLYADSGSG